MTVKVRIPTPLQSLTDGNPEVEGEGENLRQVLADLEARFPGMRERLYDDSGNLRRFVNLYLNDEDIRFLQGEDTPVGEGDRVSIIPAIAGGAASARGGADFQSANRMAGYNPFGRLRAGSAPPPRRSRLTRAVHAPRAHAGACDGAI